MAVAYGSNLTRLKTQAADRAHIAVLRKLGKSLAPPQPGRVGAPPPPVIRWATVQSVNGDGTVDLTLDGGTLNEVPCATTYSPNTGDNVVVRFLGGDLFVEGTVGGYSAGEMVAYGIGPASLTSYLTGTACTASGPVLAGGLYQVHARLIGTQITNASTIMYADMSTDDGVLVGVRFFDTGFLSVNQEGGGGGSTLYQPAATRTTVFTLVVETASASFQVGVDNAEIIVCRVG